MKFSKFFSILIVVGFISVLKPAYTTSQVVESGKQNTQVSPEVSSLEVRLSGKDLYEALISQTVSELDKLARERETLRWTIFSIVTAFLVGLITVAGIAGYKDLQQKIYAQLRAEISINESIKAAIEENVRKVSLSRIDEKVEQINKEIAFYTLLNMASDLSNKSRNSFTNSERDAVMEIIDSIKDSKDIIGRPEFLVYLEKIIDVFISAGLDDYIDNLENLLGAAIDRSSGIVYSLVGQYGMRVLGDIDVNDSTKARFSKYIDACRRHNILEIALPWLMVYEFSCQTTGWEKRIEDYFIDAQQLVSSDKQRFFSVFERYSDTTNYLRLTGQILRFTSKFQDFKKHYEKQLSELTVDISA